MKGILKQKEQDILNALGSNAKSLQRFYATARGRDKLLIRAGMWLKAAESLPAVADTGIRNSATAAGYLRQFFSNLSKTEEIWALLLDNKNRPMDAVAVHAQSSASGANLNLRYLVEQALATGASAIIISHNHPSGDPEPSREDIRMSKDLCAHLRAIEIELLDHLILTPDGRHTKIHWTLG